MATAVATSLAAPLAVEAAHCSTARRASAVSSTASFRSCSAFSENGGRLLLWCARARSSSRWWSEGGRICAQASVKSVDVARIVPQGERVLVRLEEVPSQSAGGVLLPKSAAKFERYLIGQVLAVGNEVKSAEKGQKVVFSDINAYELNLGGPDKLCFVKAADLLALVD